MLADQRPRQRLLSDSPNAHQPTAPLKAADRHARRLGVLGHVESRRHHCALSTVGVARTDGGDLQGVALVALPPIDPVRRKPPAAASVLPFPMIAA